MGQEAYGEQVAAANNVLRLKYICVMMEVTSMKKSTKRFLSSALAILLMLSLPMTANAQVVVGATIPTATLTWEENSQPCVATVMIPEEPDVLPVPIEDATIVTIVNGESKVVTWPRGNGATREPEFSVEPALADRVRLESLLLELGYELQSMRVDLEDTEQIYDIVPGGLPAGRYSFGSEFDVVDAEWSIVRGQLFGRAVISPDAPDEGTITGIPFGATAIKLIVLS